jgi:two-component system copper resistance phosphate regulon response regulator CusR
MRILVIEDEKSVASFIKKGLEEQSFIVDMAYDGAMGKKLSQQYEYDIILLDVVLPEINGIELCRQIREHSAVPIIMLTALGTTDDIVTGLDSGADDYLTKPFKFQELLARIRAAVRRKREVTGHGNFTLADLHIDFRTKQVTRNGKLIRLTAREFYLLHYFIRNKGILVSRADIAENVWENSFDTGSNVVDVYVNYLRNKIDKGYNPKLIHTVYGMGYIFEENYGDA